MKWPMKLPGLPLLLLLGVGCGGNTSESPTASTPSPTPRAGCDPSGPSLVLVVDPAIEGGIRASLATFVADLCRDGYAVVKNVEAYESPADLRRYLARVYSETQGRLRGAILVGNHPRAYQWVTALSSNPRIPDLSEEVISFQYYADLDGVFEASPSYRSRRAYSFDVHAGEVDWEIWVSVLPLYRDDDGQTVEALNRYFARNHAYRSDPAALPRAYLEISEHFRAATPAEHQQMLGFMRNGRYSWTPFSDSPSARLYFDTRPGASRWSRAMPPCPREWRTSRWRAPTASGVPAASSTSAGWRAGPCARCSSGATAAPWATWTIARTS